MIDVISSSIRLGRAIRDNSAYTLLYKYYKIQCDDSGVPACTYRDLLNTNFTKYGFYSFDYVNRIVNGNLTDEEETAVHLAKAIRAHLDSCNDYEKIVILSKEAGAILERFIDALFTSTPDFPVLDIPNKTLKMQQLSNELSTAILRTGLFSLFTDSLLVTTVKKDPAFAAQYEKQTEGYRKKSPYSKEIREIIKGLDKGHRRVADAIEGIYFMKHLVRNGIMQGFFFELYDITEEQISMYKESYSRKSIHPIVIKTGLVFPSSQLMLFRYTLCGQTNYLLARKIEIHFSPEECYSKISGYCYPTNEYRLFLDNL